MEDNIYKFSNVFLKIKSIFDDEFNEPDDKYNDKCDNFSTINGIKKEAFNAHCKKCMKYVRYLEDEYKESIETAQASLYLYYWLLDKELYNEDYTEISLDIYENLLDEYDECEVSNIHQTYKDYIKDELNNNLKNLYHLYYKFDKFKNRKNCENNNCKCAEQCADLYNTYVREHCGIPYDNIFCNELQNFANIYNDYIDKNTHNCDKIYSIRIMVMSSIEK
ncbi:hypothetical protein, conserved [Plasmodium vivax]|uniref:VIR protein n=1 Tax=Plasmodium vivax TaxID=5855 RepID=A0A1G4E5P8_PLAVI|nr:hypothetical protein, conserved [Plasmodium vivax]